MTKILPKELEPYEITINTFVIRFMKTRMYDEFRKYYKKYFGKPFITDLKIYKPVQMAKKIVKLIKDKKGIYLYDPDHINEVELFDFPPNVKEEIFKRDNYRCVVCGRGIADGVELCADHLKPKDKGGDNSIDNGQTLCMEHNLIKKNYSQTEAGKRYFIKMYKQAKAKHDEKIIGFCKCVFECYDRHGINGHIPRPNGKNNYKKE